MITYVSEARHPPRNLQPFTIKGAIAILLDTMKVDTSLVIGGIITLKGNRVPPRDIRSAINAATPPGHQYATRLIGSEQMKVWRLK